MQRYEHPRYHRHCSSCSRWSESIHHSLVGRAVAALRTHSYASLQGLHFHNRRTPRYGHWRYFHSINRFLTTKLFHSVTQSLSHLISLPRLFFQALSLITRGEHARVKRGEPGARATRGAALSQLNDNLALVLFFHRALPREIGVCFEGLIISYTALYELLTRKYLEAPYTPIIPGPHPESHGEPHRHSYTNIIGPERYLAKTVS